MLATVTSSVALLCCETNRWSRIVVARQRVETDCISSLFLFSCGEQTFTTSVSCFPRATESFSTAARIWPCRARQPLSSTLLLFLPLRWRIQMLPIVDLMDEVVDFVTIAPTASFVYLQLENGFRIILNNIQAHVLTMLEMFLNFRPVRFDLKKKNWWNNWVSILLNNLLIESENFRSEM